MIKNKKYWNSLDQLSNDKSFVESTNKEFTDKIPVEDFLKDKKNVNSQTTRRDFLKFVGFSVAAATVAACETPVIKSIPYLNKPEEVTAGIANYYASTFYSGIDFANILIKTREGRPIHIEPNKKADMYGSLNTRVNSSVLNLYDSSRLKNPLLNQSYSNWKTIDKKVKQELTRIKDNKGTIRILSNTIISPSTNEAIQYFTNYYGGVDGADVQHVSLDSISYSALKKANKKTFGLDVIPTYNFDKAKVIVSVGADFLSTWLTSNVYSNQYAKTRNPKNEWMSKHFQFETGMSLTGTNADVRGAIKPSEIGKVVVALYKSLRNEKIDFLLPSDDNNVVEKIKNAAKELQNANGDALLVCNSNNVEIQKLVNYINKTIGAYSNTIDLNNPIHLFQGDDEKYISLINEMNEGKVDALFIYGLNPVYLSPNNLKIKEAISKVTLSVSFSERNDETSTLCKIVAPDSNYLESWNDFNPYGSTITFQQPTISNLFSTRQAQESFLMWSENKTSYYDFIKQNWEKNIFPKSKELFSQTLWNKIVHDGVYHLTNNLKNTISEKTINPNVIIANILKQKTSDNWEIEMYLSNAIGDGSQANNPWLQELPDPVSKITWDNYIAMNPSDAKSKNFNIKYGQKAPATIAKITIKDTVVELPVIAQPGQKKGTVSIALGYGRIADGKVLSQGDSKSNGKSTIGQNIFSAIEIKNNLFQYFATDVTIKKTSKTHKIGSTQTNHTMMGRKIINETSLKTYKEKSRDYWNPKVKINDAYGNKKPVGILDLWKKQDIEKGHRWGMSIDLNSCIGCGTCVTACNSENNVPVVGKDEINRTRTMSWLRIDRYFSSDMTKVIAKNKDIGKIDMYNQMENSSDYPEVTYQPVMCQQCNHAPCETVCPVAATTHSNEGLNQMTYNRCIGTRYCANNCPYKVRKFNWFNYVGDSKFTDINPSQSELSRMVLNPDVVVRSRGVMEKCSFCVQRIQAGKLSAKKEGRAVIDGEITSACSSVCPTNAIYFGDLNDNKTQVHEKLNDERTYFLLEEVGTQPNVMYMTKVKNVDKDLIHEALASVKPNNSSNHETH